MPDDCEKCAEQFGIPDADRHRQHHEFWEKLFESLDADPRRIARMVKWLDDSAQAHEDRQAVKRVLGRWGMKPAWMIRAAGILVLLGVLWAIYGDWHNAVKRLIELLGSG